MRKIYLTNSIGWLLILFVVLASCTPKTFSDKKDVEFILNWGQIADKANVVSVLHSYRSGTTPTGDYTDACCIQLDTFPDDRVNSEAYGQKIWISGPVPEGILTDALQRASNRGCGGNCDWLPSFNDLNSDRFYLCFESIHAFNFLVDQATIIAYDRKTKLLYYVSAQT